MHRPGSGTSGALDINRPGTSGARPEHRPGTSGAPDIHRPGTSGVVGQQVGSDSDSDDETQFDTVDAPRRPDPVPSRVSPARAGPARAAGRGRGRGRGSQRNDAEVPGAGARHQPPGQPDDQQPERPNVAGRRGARRRRSATTFDGDRLIAILERIEERDAARDLFEREMRERELLLAERMAQQLDQMLITLNRGWRQADLD